MDKPFEGKRYGCSDTSPPEMYSSYQLSRLADAMYSAQEAGLDPKDVFKLAPEGMKLEWNYSHWSYRRLK
jgi:hypothetical protein